VLAFWLFAQTTLNISPVMADDLGIETSLMNIAVSITALFSGIFIVVVGGLADRFGRVRMVRLGFLARARTPAGDLAVVDGLVGRVRVRRAVRRPDGRERRLALDLLRRRGDLPARHAHGGGHAREPGRGEGAYGFDTAGVLTAGILIVARLLVRAGGGMTAQQEAGRPPRADQRWYPAKRDFRRLVSASVQPAGSVSATHASI
jgi:MFS family permease